MMSNITTIWNIKQEDRIKMTRDPQKIDKIKNKKE